jgi:hypothetical protein
MEDVLAVYTRPRDPDRPLVCLDETSKQLIAETRVPIPMKRGRPARVDYEYERNGTANLFMLFAPLEGWRHVEVTDHRAAVDYAHVLKYLADIRFAHAKTIVLVQDNLNIHAKGPLYEAFPPAEARRLAERFDGTTPRSMAVGSIWPSPSWRSSLHSASTAAFPTSKPLSAKSLPGNRSVMQTTPSQTGTSPPRMLELSSSIYTLQSD